MAAVAGADFEEWLNEKLKELNTDEGVFGSYINGILEGDENNDEKVEALEGILIEIIEKNLSEIVHEIIDKWNACHPKCDEKSTVATKADVDAQLAKMLEAQKIQTTVQRQYTAEELRIREQILAQYSQLSVSEDSEEGSAPEDDPSLVKNTNAQDVQQALKERREQAKLESQKKKEKDKEDREKQKQLREEKKEKRKTVKGERRR